MGATRDSALINSTLDFMSNKSRDQDVLYFFVGLSRNEGARRLLADFFKKQYDVVRFCIIVDCSQESMLPLGSSVNVLKAPIQCDFLYPSPMVP